MFPQKKAALSIRMVAGCYEIIERKSIVVAEA